MTDYKQISIFGCGMIVSAAFTVISPFYPNAAHEKGVPFWTIGLVFSLVPISGLITSLFLGNFMYKFGRRPCYVSGIVLVGFSNIMISLIEFGDTSSVIFFSLTSRVMAGIGASLCLTSGYAFLTSEYSEDVQKVVAKMEVCCGIGLIAGPLIGSALFIVGGIFGSFLLLGIILVAYAPLGSYLLGETRPYVITDEKISVFDLLIKPRILLDAVCQAMIMFGIGFIAPTFEIHLLNLGVPEQYSGIFYSFNTGSYALNCYLIGYLPSYIDRRLQMGLGLLILSFSFLLLGPCPFFLPQSLYIVTIGLFFLGVGGALMYVPSLPNMIENAHIKYEYSQDDRLNDALSGITNFALNFGEMLGPTTAGVLISKMDFPYAASVIALILAIYAVIYITQTDIITDFYKPKEKSIKETLLVDMKHTDIE